MGLLDLQAGDCGIVEGIGGSQQACKRLADLGFVPGAEITMIRPGSPCIIRIGGRCVGLGAEHQRAILLNAV
ncbi:MAG: ferrous iron transport protein A [Phycisphaerales bacterium]|nr:MAG: ferrous iron transport protein A [Phycisphaerales bacterium]